MLGYQECPFDRKKPLIRDGEKPGFFQSPAFFKARASGLTRALKLITRAFLGFVDPIDFTNVTPN